MDNAIRWIRISYWVGAIGDFLIAVFALVPARMGLPGYAYPMGLLSAVAFSWGCMLIWADRDPVPRRWILKPTILVGSCLFIAVAASVAVGAIPLRMVAANLIALPSVVALWTFSYLNARQLDGA
jgi:hypothetical protein